MEWDEGEGEGGVGGGRFGGADLERWEGCWLLVDCCRDLSWVLMWGKGDRVDGFAL